MINQRNIVAADTPNFQPILLFNYDWMVNFRNVVDAATPYFQPILLFNND